MEDQEAKLKTAYESLLIEAQRKRDISYADVCRWAPEFCADPDCLEYLLNYLEERGIELEEA